MLTQNYIEKYRKIYLFHSPFGRLEAIKRICSVIYELDIFDVVRGVNTRTIKVQSLEKQDYMPYWPAFTSVVREMIRLSHNYYISAIRYSNLNRKTVFVDLGSGMGKTLIIAAETQKFDLCAGIEIDKELVEVAKSNLLHMQKK